MRPLLGLLAVFLILCFGQSCTGDASGKTVVVFKAETTDVSCKGNNGEIIVRKPYVFRVPAFVGGVLDNKEFLAVISGACFYTSAGSTPDDGVAKVSYGDHSIWSGAEIFTNDTKTSATHILRGDFTAVMKNNKIYVLATSYQREESPSSSGGFDKRWDPLMFIGTIIDSTGSGVSGKSVKWDEGKSLKNELAKDLRGAEVTVFFGGMGNGVVTESGEIVFPIRITLENRQSSSSVLRSTADGSTWSIGGHTELGTYDGSVVEWNDGKLLFIVPSDNGYRRVFQSDDVGSTWNESFMFSGVWGGEPNRWESGNQGSVIKVPVDEKDVLLFAHPLTDKGGSNADTLQLWLSDGQHIVRIGTISEEDKEEHSGNSILALVGNHLYITHEINPNGVWEGPEELQKWSSVIGLTPLPQFFESAKTTARAWKKLDELFLSKGVPTNGLVGFLGNTQKDNSVWEDMYMCVDATVSGGKSVDGGFCFDGNPGSGAEWPVESQGQNQVYIFADKQFTLAATVTIHAGSEEGQFALIGASLDSQGSNVLLGLGYTHDNKWFSVSHKSQQTTTEETFVREREYHIALTFANGVASVYVDGGEITNSELKIQKTLPINHFYMGAIEQSSTAKGSSCTVKNVMLFSVALEQSEIAKLTKVSQNNKLGELASSALPTFIPEVRIPEPKTESTAVPDIGKSVPTTKSTTIPGIIKSVHKTKSTAVPDDSYSLTTRQTKEASVSSPQTVTTGKADDKNVSKSQHKLRDAVFKKDTKGDNGAVVSLCAVGWMCFVCSFIALSGL